MNNPNNNNTLLRKNKRKFKTLKLKLLKSLS